MKIDLKTYKKIKKNDSTSKHVSSVNITKEQKEFLEENGLNLSHLIRDFLEDLINKTKKDSSI